MKDQLKIKVFADVKINVTENLTFVLERVENIVGKGENADSSIFFTFLSMFSKSFYKRCSIYTGKSAAIFLICTGNSCSLVML